MRSTLKRFLSVKYGIGFYTDKDVQWISVIYSSCVTEILYLLVKNPCSPALHP